MDDDEIRTLTSLAVEAAKIGAAAHRAGWSEGFSVTAKGEHGDVVTNVDVAAESAIREFLLASRPGDSFVGEESAPLHQDSGVRWIVDPIDGTANYLRRSENCAVSVGVEIDRDHVIGVVHQSATGKVWIGSPLEAARNGTPIGVAKRWQLSETVWATGFAPTPTDRERQLALFNILMRNVRDCRRTGSPAIDLANVAEGTVDGYVEFGLGLEDYAGGAALVTAAGGHVDIIDISPWTGPLVIAAGTHELVAAMREVVRSAGIPNT